MLNMIHARRLRIERGIQPAAMQTAVGITKKRLTQLENNTGSHSEPWFDEAVRFARVLGVGGIMPLLNASGDLTTTDVGRTLETDRDLWRSGLRLDITSACRIAKSFGLRDPLELVEPPAGLLAQIWSVVASGERLHALGGQAGCPWCTQPIVGDAGHLPTCLADNLLGVRSREMAPTIVTAGTPRLRGTGYGKSGLGHGLERIRSRAGWTQRQMGDLLGISSDYYSKLERCAQNIIWDRAVAIANKFGIDPDEVYFA